MARKKEEVVEKKINIALALKELCEAKGLPVSVVVDAMSEALKKAYFKFSGDYPDTIMRVDIDMETGNIKMFKIKNVVAEIQDDVFETDPEEAYEETGVKYNVGDIIETPIDIDDFRRAAAMQAKSVFKQKLREAEKAAVVEQFQSKIGTVQMGTVEAVEEKHCVIKIGRTNAYLNTKNMLPNEKLLPQALVKVYVEEVDKTAIGTPIIVSRTNPRFITCLMEQEISEIHDGIVEIKGVARQPGSRSKVAVYSKDANVDPSGACIGPHGSRIARVLSQIKGEKIDVVNYSDNPLLFVADALKPASVAGIQLLDEENKACRAIVNEDQYTLAIGKDAQNVNLAVRLTGWKIDIKSVTDAQANGYSYESVEELKAKEALKRGNHTVKVTPVVSEITDVVNSDDDEVMPYMEEAKLANDNVVKEVKVEEVKEEIKEETKEEVKVEEVKEKEEEKVVVHPTRKSTANVFSELEAALNANSSIDDSKQTAKKKKYTKKNEEEKELGYDSETTKKKDNVVPSNVLPVYTEEELEALEDEERAEEDSKYDDEIDYDEFDDYYDDEK